MTGQLKIGIHLPNRDTSGVILSHPENGNPGVGGTQFQMFALPYYMRKYYPGRFEFIYFAERCDNIITDFRLESANTLEDAAEKSMKLTCSILIFRPTYDNETLNFLRKIRDLELKAIAWMHNSNKLILNHLSLNRSVVCCVCPGRDQYETLRDHSLIRKLIVISNAIDPEIYPKQCEKEKTVVFLGSLSFAKGFHLIARSWKKILRFHPDARLIVIGSGNLYDRNTKLGPLNLAESGYEKLFRKYVLDGKGEMLQSVQFLGILGNEKNEVMKKASVGIVTNPLIRETFCLAAVEFQLCGTPVVSSPYGGLNDTVANNIGGFLRGSCKERIECILKLLSDVELAGKMGSDGKRIVSERFNYSTICKDWHDLLLDIEHGSNRIVILEPAETNTKNLDLARERIRILKSRYPLFRMIIPSVYVLHFIEFIKLRLQKFRFWAASFID